MSSLIPRPGSVIIHFLLAVLCVSVARAQVQVSTSYNDEPRNGFAPFSNGSWQPVPWYGNPGTIYYGNTNTAAEFDPDIDAILLQNFGIRPVVLSAASIASYNLFSLDSITNPITLQPGGYVILAGVDGSDILGNVVTVGLTLDGTNYSYSDATNTLAYDGVLYGVVSWQTYGAESVPWTPINSIQPAAFIGLGSPAWTTNGLNLTAVGAVGGNYEVDVSTNLVNWVSFTNFSGTITPLNFSDPAAANYKQRFYRVFPQ